MIAIIETEGIEEINVRKVDEIKKIEPVSVDNSEEVVSEEDNVDSADTTAEETKRLNK